MWTKTGVHLMQNLWKGALEDAIGLQMEQDRRERERKKRDEQPSLTEQRNVELPVRVDVTVITLKLLHDTSVRKSVTR